MLEKEAFLECDNHFVRPVVLIDAVQGFPHPLLFSSENGRSGFLSEFDVNAVSLESYSARSRKSSLY